MFRHAGLSIAMENALDSVKQAATCIAPSNNDDGAVWAIQQILNAK